MFTELYSFIFGTMFCTMAYYMLSISLSTLLVMVFMVMVCVSAYFYYMFMGAFMTYLLFLVYVGGLLVLITYMVMVSMNFSITSFNTKFILLLFMGTLTSSFNMLFPVQSMLKYFESAEMLWFSFSSLVILGSMLLYIFLGVCNSIIVGGRSLTFGT